MEGRECTKCKEFKPWSEFNKLKAGKNGRNSQCKACSSKYFKKHYLNGGKEKSLKWQRDNTKLVRKNVEKYQSRMQPGVYIIYTDEGTYIGESIKMERRVWNHKHWNSRSPVKTKVLKWEVLEVVPDEQERKLREQYWIKKLKPELNNKDYHWGSKYTNSK